MDNFQVVRIAHMFTTFYPGPGALGRAFYLAEDQRRRGWQVTFVTGHNASPELIQEKQSRGFAVTQVASLRKYVHPLNDLKALGALVSLFRKQKFEVVHTHWAKAGVLGRLAARQAGVKNIVHSVYGPTFSSNFFGKERHIYRTLERLAGKFTSQFIFVGRELQETYIRAGICNRENSQVIYGGRDLSVFQQAALLSEEDRRARKRAMGLDPETLVIGYLARMVPSKGHIYAIRAFLNLNLPPGRAKLMFVGAARVPSEQAFLDELKSEISKLGLEREVIFTGWQADPAHYYGVFDIFIFPSLYEGLPGTVLEARVAGLPIVAFDCGGVREILGNNGNLVPVKDVAGLTRSLEKEIMRLLETRPRRGQNLAEVMRLQEVFSIDGMVSKTAQLYERLLADPKNLVSLQE